MSDALSCHPFVRLVAPDWSSGPVVILTRHRDRRIGLRPLPGPFGALLEARSIHTFGMHAPIGVVALDKKGLVIRAAVVPPRRVLFAPTARWLLETASTDLPNKGVRLKRALDS